MLGSSVTWFFDSRKRKARNRLWHSIAARRFIYSKTWDRDPLVPPRSRTYRNGCIFSKNIDYTSSKKKREYTDVRGRKKYGVSLKIAEYICGQGRFWKGLNGSRFRIFRAFRVSCKRSIRKMVLSRIGRPIVCGDAAVVSSPVSCGRHSRRILMFDSWSAYYWPCSYELHQGCKRWLWVGPSVCGNVLLILYTLKPDITSASWLLGIPIDVVNK